MPEQWKIAERGFDWYNGYMIVDSSNRVIVQVPNPYQPDYQYKGGEEDFIRDCDRAKDTADRIVRSGE